MKSYLILAIVLVGLLVLLVQSCNNRPTPFIDWRREQHQRKQEQKKQQIDNNDDNDGERYRRFRRLRNSNGITDEQ